MRKSFGKAAACAGVAAAALLAQAPATAPGAKVEFEVATVKVAQPLASQVAAGKLHVGMKIDGARVDIGSLSLADLIPIAFKVKPYQISGPDWMSTQRFDILAKIPDGVTQEQVPEMLQALLASRFKLAFHRESREHAVYALVVGKDGPKLKASVAEPESPQNADDAKGGITIGSQDGTPARITRSGNGIVVSGAKNGTARITPGPDGSMRIEASKMTMEALADTLSRFVDRPVVDMTELKGSYQVALDLSLADLMKVARAMGAQAPGAIPASTPAAAPADAASDPGASSIFSNVQQLGLKLEPRKAPVETIVVDHLEKLPTEN